MDKICLLPWIHLHTWPNNKVFACCMSPQDQPVGDLGTQTLAEIYNDQPMRSLRTDMLEGREPSRCSRCFEQERAGQFSLRQDVNERFQHHQDMIASTQADGTVDNMRLVYWDFRFSNICNFRCRSCGPQLSTGWYDDHRRAFGGLPRDIPDPKKNPNIWAQIEPLFETVEEIYFAGGEPLIMEEHYRILQRLEAMGRYDVKLRYNTNFSQLQYKNLDVLSAWSKFKLVKIDASFDGYGAAAEYIRKGTRWSDTVRNVMELHQRVPHAEFGINCTTSIQNAFHVADFWRWCADTQFIRNPDDFHVNLVQDPQWLRLDALPPTVKQQLSQLYTDTADRAQAQGYHRVARDFRGARRFMLAQDQQHLLAQFRLKMQQLDSLRGESFAATFPELRELTCE